MSTWSIKPLNESNIDDFVRSQFLAFVGNPLHDVVFPSPEAAASSIRKGLADSQTQKPGNALVYLKAVDETSGQLIGGIKYCVSAHEDVKTTSPYAPSKTAPQNAVSEEERYRSFVMGEFLGRRAKGTMYLHALIDLLFVHPEHGGKGVGRELIQRACAAADERGLPAVVEASPRGKRTYERCGFVSRGPVTITSEDWPGRPDNLYYWMERPRADRS